MMASGGKAVESKELIDTLRWHTLRYDNLRASVASRGSFVLGANAFLVAGVALLMPTGSSTGRKGGGPEWIVAPLLMTISCVIVSAFYATWTFTNRRRWRKELSDPPNTRALFYQHSDTVNALDSFTEFETKLCEQSDEEEIDRSMVNVWMMIQTHSKRYHNLRIASRWMQGGILGLLVSIAIFALLGGGIG